MAVRLSLKQKLQELRKMCTTILPSVPLNFPVNLKCHIKYISHNSKFKKTWFLYIESFHGIIKRKVCAIEISLNWEYTGDFWLGILDQVW